MGWRICKRTRGSGKAKRGENSEALSITGCFRVRNQEMDGEQKEAEDTLEIKELENVGAEDEIRQNWEDEEAKQDQEQVQEQEQDQDQEEEVRFMRMRWVPVKRRRFKFVRRLCCCLRRSRKDDDEDDEEYFKRLSNVWSRRKNDGVSIPVDEDKEDEFHKKYHAVDHNGSQECKREAVYSLASYVKNAALQLNQETSKLRRLHCELQNIEEICKQLVLFMIEDRGTHWRDYESLFLLLMVMVKPLFHRVLQYEEFPVMIKAVEKLREYIHEILVCAKRIMGFFSSGEHEALEGFMKASKEWLSHFAGDDESSKLDDTFIPDDEDLHLKYNFLTRRIRKNPNCDVKEKILGKNYHQRKHKNVEEYHASNCNQVTLVEHPFKHVIPYLTRPKHSKGLFMEFYHEEKAFNETPQRLYMLQTVMIYVVDTQKKVQIDETRILKLRDEFETIEEALIQVMDFICEDKEVSTTEVYENKLLEIKKVTQPMFRHVIQQEEWPKLTRMMKAIKSLCYKIVFRVQRWHFLNIFSQEMIGKMKILLDDVSDWMVDVGDKISAFETCERIEESQRFNNVLPDNEVLYSRIMRRIQKLRNNETDEIDVWNSCHYHRDLGFSRPSIVTIDSRLSNDDESNCDRKDSRLKLRGGGVATEVCQLKVFASVDSQADSAKCCYAHPVSSGDLQASDPSATGKEETGTNKRNTGQGDVCVTEKKQEENPAQNSVNNMVLDMVNSKQSQMSLDMAIVMWICALLYFWKHVAGFN